MGACQSDPRPQSDLLISDKERKTIEKPLNIKICRNKRNRRSNANLRIASNDQNNFNDNDNLNDLLKTKNEDGPNSKQNKKFTRPSLIKKENLIVENNVEEVRADENNFLMESKNKKNITENKPSLHSAIKNDKKTNNSGILNDNFSINNNGNMQKEEIHLKKPNLLRCNGGENLENNFKNIEETKNNNHNKSINESAFEESSIFKIYQNTDRRINDTLNNTNCHDNNLNINDKVCMDSVLKEEEEEDKIGENRYNISQILKNQKIINLSNIIVEKKQLLDDENYLYIVTIIDNLCLCPQKQKLYLDFKQKISKIKKARLVIMEYASMGLPFIEANKLLEPFHYQMRNENNFNQKFSYYNFLIKKLPTYMKYIAFMDYEIEVLDDDWINETLHHLKKGANFVKMHNDFIFTNKHGEILFPNDKINKEQNLFQFGFLFAANRHFLEEIEGFPDFLFIEESDEIVAACIENKVHEILPRNINDELRISILNWAKKIEGQGINLKIVNSTITKYISERMRKNIKKNGLNILIDNKFDPARDLVKNKDGISCLKKEKEKIIKELKEYFNYIQYF